MALSNRAAQQEYIVVKIEQVDLANRIAHVRDKTNSPLLVSFREAPGGILHVPAQDQKWTAKRLGATWHLEAKLDSLSDARWAADNMQSGDTRITSDGTVHVLTEGMEINQRAFGATVRDFFYSASAGFTSVTLSGTPVSADTVQVHLNGQFVPHTVWTLSGRTITFNTTMAAGNLTVHYQTMLTYMDDAGTVIGRTVIPANVYDDLGLVTGTAVISGSDIFGSGGYGVETYGTGVYGT